MAARDYRLGRRGEMAEETRRRIVAATYALHGEQGITATTMKQIAARANVGIGTVYHHFPTYDLVIEACGAFTDEVTRPPTAAIFRGARSRKERIQRLAAELFAYYARIPSLERVRAERHKLPVLDQVFSEWEASLDDLVRRALEPADDDVRLVGFAAALLDAAVHRVLAEHGLATPEAAANIADAILARLRQATTTAKAGR